MKRCHPLSRLVLLILLAAILTFMTAEISRAADTISLVPSEPATIYYTTSGATPVISAVTPTVNTPVDAIKQVARDGIKFHLKNARIDQDYRHMGFESQNALDTADVGEVFQILTIDNEKLGDESVPLDLQRLVVPGKHWECLVYGSGKATSLLTVYSVGKKWKFSSPRTSKLAKKMSDFLTAWPASAGYQYRFIRVYPLADYIELSQFGTVLGFFSLDGLSGSTDRTAGTFTFQDLLAPQSALTNMRSAVRQYNESKARGEPSEDIKKAGREGVSVHLLGRSHNRNFSDLGFASQNDIDKAELGEGIQIFTINTRKLLDETVPLDLGSLVIPTGQWDFLVRAEGKATALLKVRFVDGAWKSVGIGASFLAKELSGFLAAWPVTDGYAFRYIRLQQSSSDLIELSRNGKLLGVFSLRTPERQPGRGVDEFNLINLRDPQEVLAELRSEIKRNIEFNKRNQSKTVQ